MSDDEEEMPILVDTATMTKQIPVSILTGFLGSGKTTLLNYLLRHQHGKRIAIIENEFSGGLGIENMIAKSGIDGEDMADFFELNNGCICCSVKEDLLATLEQLVLHKDRFDYVLIETTGVANPGPIITSLWADDALESSLRLDGVITVVDSVNIRKYLSNSDTSHDVRMQLAFADRILLNKSDLMTPEKMKNVEEAVRQINSAAEVRHTSFSQISPDWVLDSDSYSMSNIRSLPMLNDYEIKKQSHDHNHSDNCECKECPPTTLQPHSATTLSTHSFLIPGIMDLAKLKLFLDRLLYSFESEEPSAHRDSSEPFAGIKRGHGDTKAVTSIKYLTPPPVSSTVSDAMRNSSDSTSACRIYRMKGIFQVSEEVDNGNVNTVLHLLQAVHDVFDIDRSDVARGSEDDKSEGLNKIIVIGKNMDKAYLDTEFRNCLV